MSTADDIRGWLAGEFAHATSQHRRLQLARLTEHLKRAEAHPHANALPVGSFQRQIARRHERKLVQEAMHLGFHLREEELKELGLHAAGQALGLSL